MHIHTISATPTTKESIFSISRFKTGVKRILRASVRIPRFRKQSLAPAPTPPPIFITSEPLLPQNPADPPIQTANPRHSIGDTSVDDRLFRRFEFVDPNSLTYTPTPAPHRDLVPGSARSSFIPPSPSWIASKVTSELEASSNEAASGLSLEIDGPVQKVPILSLTVPTLPATAPSASLSPLDVHEANEDGHEALTKSQISALPLTSRSSSANSKISFATANSDFSANEFSGMQFFQDTPPPRPEPTPAAPAPAPYVPSTPVIEQNEAFLFALESAPNVLYSKWKQYGQLGVLGWCAEFSELIDHLKDLGFNGNMFVTTRSQALKTCEEILKLELIHEVKMQIIVMYLSYQIARLRRFLDGDRVWTDYPEPQFPVNVPTG
ncbi:hypothetical protein NMY22_g3665 [Coprinellus aureogranulatus]|nr:hypothetical protein NMY22_g3665 [Coprinellus aureogranulatus]